MVVLVLRTRSEKSHGVVEVAFVGLGDSLLGGRHPVEPLHVPKGPGVRAQPGGLAVPAPGAPLGQHLEQGRQEGRAASRAPRQLQHGVQLAGDVPGSHQEPGEPLGACAALGGALDTSRKPVKAATEANANSPSALHAL